jgi:hypothetical protein
VVTIAQLVDAGSTGAVLAAGFASGACIIDKW